MCGRPNLQRSMLAIVDPEERVPRDHPLRQIKEVADAALAQLSPEFDLMYARVGRASLPPERLLKASLLIALNSVRSERAFCKELEYNLLYCWFLDMDLMERSFDATVFTQNRQRLVDHDVGRALFDDVVWAADGGGAAVGRTLQRGRNPDRGGRPRSFRPKGGPPQPTDPETRLLRKGRGKEAKLAFPGHALMENRHSLLMNFTVSPATGTAEREAVVKLLDEVRARSYRPHKLGGDRGDDTRNCVKDIQTRRETPYVAQKQHSAIDGRTTRHAGYAVSLRQGKRGKEVFGWMKTISGLRRTRYRDQARTGPVNYLVPTTYNLVCMAHFILEPHRIRAIQITQRKFYAPKRGATGPNQPGGARLAGSNRAFQVPQRSSCTPRLWLEPSQTHFSVVC